MENLTNKLKEAVDYIKSKTQVKPTVGIILGTGLGSLADEIENSEVLEYDDIPNFPISTVEFHHGRLIFGLLSGKPVVVMQGRFHYYEGYSMVEVTFPVRVMKLLGIQDLIVSNAAGGINRGFNSSDLVLLKDHINLFPENPLRGKNLDELGPRFPDMFEPYSSSMRERALKIASEKGITCKEGVYAGVTGPNLETPAEYKYLEIIGADMVGMSTIPEVIVALHMGLNILAMSVITDLCYPEALKPVVIEEIFAAAGKAEPNMTLLIKEFLKD